MYNYYPLKIEVYYFNCLNPNDRDLFLNKISFLQTSLDGCKTIFRQILDSEEMRFLKVPCLNKEQKEVCFNNGSVKNKTLHGTTIVLDGKKIKLSFVDMECLYYLKFGSSITQIAQCVGRSSSTIKDRIKSLKIKFDVQKKEDLVNIARSDLSFLTKDLFEINNIKIQKII